MTATTARAQFLLSQDRYAIASSTTIRARWGEDAGDIRHVTALALKAAADAEAVRQLALFGYVLCKDVVTIKGRHRGLVGRTVRVPYNGKLDLAGNVDLLVTADDINESAGSTKLTGWVRL